MDLNHRRTGAGSELDRIYEEQPKQAGAVTDVIKIYSLNPAALSAHLRVTKASMHTNGGYPAWH